MYRKRNEKAKGEAPRQNLKNPQVVHHRPPSLKLALEGGFKKIRDRQPPGEVSSPILQRKVLYRFASTLGTEFNTDFTIADGHNQFLMSNLASIASPLYSYVDCWRIKRIKFYVKANEADKSARLVFTPVAIDADNFMTDINNAQVMTGDSSNLPHCYEYVPSKYHPCGSWHRTSTTNSSAILFIIGNGPTVDGNTFIEISFEYVLNTTGIPNGYTVIPSSVPTADTMYTGVWGDNTNAPYVPQGVNTLFLS